MNELLSKISSYSIFNFLFPGIIFSVLSADVINYPVHQSDILARLFLYYFVGLVISRLGSLTVGPALRKIKFVQFAEYKDYLTASRKDPKIEVFLELGNTYRTLTASFGLLILVKLYARIKSNLLLSPQGWGGELLAAFLFVVFLFRSEEHTSELQSLTK